MVSSHRVIPLSSPDITELEKNRVMEVLNGPHLSQGPRLSHFETLIGNYIGTKHAIAVNSGTSALHLAVRALGIEDGDEVITTPFSFVASANCLLYERAVPVFVDIDPITLNLNVTQIESKITSRTKAILPVHVFGQPCDLTRLVEIASKYGLKIIEDACEAIGARFGEKRVGAFGKCGVFAFYPNKQLTTGEGGILVTNDDDIAELCRSLRNQGRGTSNGWLTHERLGYNYRLSDLNCALGIAQMERVEELLSKRAEVAGLYTQLLKEVSGIRVLTEVPGTIRSWFVYVVVLSDYFSKRQRDLILNGLTTQKIGCSNYFPPIHLQPFYANQFGYKRGDFPVTEAISDRTVALPFYSSLSPDDIQFVVECLKEEMDRARDAVVFSYPTV